MDCKSFDRAMERAGKALFLENDTESCMKIMQLIINKFDPHRVCREILPSIPHQLACFIGTCSVNEAIAIHVSMAKLWAATGELKPMYIALQHLLVLSFFWRQLRPSSALSALPLADDHTAHSMITSTSNLRFQLPAEIWCEVASWLSRPDWRTLLYVPHPLRRFAFNLFFRDIFLQFDVYGYHPGDVGPDSGLGDLEAWHSKRTLDIITRILRDRAFANRVRTLKVLMHDRRANGSTNIIDLNVVCLIQALWKMTGLKGLYLYGSPVFLDKLVLNLPRIFPRLQAVTIKYRPYNGREFFPRISAPWDYIEQLCIDPIADNPSINGLQQFPKCLRQLRIKHQLNVAPIIATLTGKLTHLEVLAPWGEAGETSLFEIVLGTCGLLESFRVMGCSMQTHSVYFRQYPRSLPLLRDFAVCLPPDPLAAVDPDLFPAICDFLRDRPMLESLELISSDFEIDQPAFGFDTHVWEFLSSLQHLRILSTRTLDEIPHQRMVELLPRLLTTLTVSMCSWHLERMLQKDGWPDGLRFFGLNDQLHQSTISFAKKVAASVPSVRVVRVGDDYFSVTGREEGEEVRVDKWSSRAAKIFRKEYLEVYGCEDREYLYADEDGVLFQ